MYSKGLLRLDPVTRDAFIENMIEIENRNQKLFTNFSLNPFKRGCFEDAIKQFDRVPKEKYCYPITTSHEYGWYCPKPHNTDLEGMFHFNKKKTGIELYMQPKKKQ